MVFILSDLADLGFEVKTVITYALLYLAGTLGIINATFVESVPYRVISSVIVALILTLIPSGEKTVDPKTVDADPHELSAVNDRYDEIILSNDGLIQQYHGDD